MRSSRLISLRRWCAAMATGLAVLTSSCNGLPLLPEREGDDGCPGCQAKSCTKPTVMALAHDLDCLEKHIERYGSVVAKQPDVWGQARMTQHRDEFEKQMKLETSTFKESLQGSLSRSDQAFFSQALALSAAVSGQQAGVLPPSPVLTESVTATKGTTVVTPTPLPAPTATAPTTTDFDTVIKRSDAMKPLGVAFTSSTGGTLSISLEPTERIDQEARYLNHLQHLRRINEGDDTADAPGYSLNLVRLPVSVLPGKCTDEGYGAEISFTATPYLSPELLPMTFRNLVVNDLLDQLGLPLTQVLNDKDLVGAYLSNKDKVREVLCALRCECADEGLNCRQDIDPPCPPPSPCQEEARTDGPASAPLARRPATPVQRTYALQLRQQLRSRIVVPSLPATKGRRALLPFPPSQMFEVYGAEPLFNVAHEAYLAFQRDPANRQFVHYPDVQGYLQEELNGAYKFLADPHNHGLWDFCNPDLVTAIRTHQDEVVRSMRCHFLIAVQNLTKAPLGTPECVPLPDVAHSALATFAWAYIVESALLTDQLVTDMKQTAAAKGCGCAHEGWQPYYLPDPPPEARQAFNEYVHCRWPIHVFALDPENETQNIADAFSLRRELQLAMSLAFVSGQINANSMTRFARRIEQDYETIALNRTIVGFSHGEDTFGWRFYPRFQTPDIAGNLTVFFRDLLIGGPNRNAVLRQRRLEPGIRECVAIVIMPSFVPYVTFDSTANWFKLTDPKCKELNAAQAMRLSRAVKSIQECGAHAGDGDCYRCGDLPLLLRKAEQLSQRLPLQSQMVQVPYENTLGGFAMFNTGVTDLAPQLKGWYGTEGINPNTNTTLFLVGDHFSVLSTRVVAGGVEVPAADHQQLLSRQVVQVIVPPGAQVLHDKDGDFVDVHVATPYGITQHLLIPAYTPGTPKAATKADEGFTLDKSTLEISYCWDQGKRAGGGSCVFKPICWKPDGLNLQWKDATGSVLPAVHISFKFSDQLAEAQDLRLTKDKTGAFSGDYAIDVPHLAATIATYLNSQGFNPNNPPESLTLATQAIDITPTDGTTGVANTHGVQKVSCNNTLTVTFKADPAAAKQGCCPPVPCPELLPPPKVTDKPQNDGAP